jgi:sugar phosphate isomerase/epimerase
LGNSGVKVNLDLGTMIYYNKDVDILKDKVHCINHVHISEPYLAPIVSRKLHKEVVCDLLDAGYGGFFSIEMGKQDDLQPIKDAILYVKEIFRGF